MAALLVGPPEIYSAAGDASADFMVSNLNKTTTTYKTVLTKGPPENRPPMGLPENRSPTFLSMGDPCLDFFLHTLPDTPPASLITRLKLAWDHDPLKSLKLVFNLRGVKGTGKSNREGFYTAALWLHDHHPKTLAANVAAIADFGYFKDLLEILFRLLEGADARKTATEMGKTWKSWKSAKGSFVKFDKMLTKEKQAERATDWRNSTSVLFLSRKIYRNQMVASWEKLETGQTLTRQEKRVERAKRVVKRFNNDPHFAFLHEQISNLFAERLRSDMVSLNSGDLKKIGLAAKWCPSLDSSFDRISLLCETIGKKMFPRAEYAEYREIEEAHYAYRVRDRLRKEVLVPLRKALKLPEVFMGANDWGSLPYNRVASVAMKKYSKMFTKHDEARFREYLYRVESGKAKIAAASALLPHQIIAALKRAEDRSDDSDEEEEEEMVSPQEVELQWKRTMDDVAKNGKFSSCIAICDVSGSMRGTPKNISVALGILVSELSGVPWKEQLITFSENPELQRVRGESLGERAASVRRMIMKSGTNIDFKKVFDVFLRIAMRENLMSDGMVKRVFVFSDKDYDRASLRPWETDYEAIVRKYRERGYGCVPEIVFWNLRDSKATPVVRNRPGVTIVNGYSKNLMTVFLQNGGVMDPVAVMEAAIAGEEYQKLVVVD